MAHFVPTIEEARGFEKGAATTARGGCTRPEPDRGAAWLDSRAKTCGEHGFLSFLSERPTGRPVDSRGMTPLQAEETFACLDRHHVRYVLIGGLAAVLHGSPLPTLDINICPLREPENLAQLAAALDDMDARIRTADSPDGVRFPCDAEFLAGVELLNLQTRFGDLDLSYKPAGTGGFDDLAQRAVEMAIQDSLVAVATLEDVIHSKETADRPKDHRSLPVLRQLLSEIRKRRDDPTS